MADCLGAVQVKASMKAAPIFIVLLGLDMRFRANKAVCIRLKLK